MAYFAAPPYWGEVLDVVLGQDSGDEGFGRGYVSSFADLLYDVLEGGTVA